jgi:hypothetical protein
LVTGSDGARVQFKRDSPHKRLVQLKPNQPFCLIGVLHALDAPGEWYLDAAGGTLYLWAPDGKPPADGVVTVKRRQAAFDLGGRNHIHVEGFSIRAATITTDDASRHCRLVGLDARHVSHETVIGEYCWNAMGLTTGLRLFGEGHELRDSRIAFSAGNGVTVRGRNHVIENCIIHDVNYRGTDCAAIQTGFSNEGITLSEGHRIVRNTLYNAGRSVLVHRSSGGLTITHNHIYNAGLLMDDLGVTYCYKTDGKGTVIAYNRVHGNRAHCGPGIYLDNWSSNFIVHHNVVWDCQVRDKREAIRLNTPATAHQVYNNSFIGSIRGWGRKGDPGFADVKVWNNLAIEGSFLGNDQQSNLKAKAEWCVDAKRGDFRLREGGPAIDKGRIIQGITDGFNGAAPDVGAHEYGADPWTAGARLPPRGTR